MGHDGGVKLEVHELENLYRADGQRLWRALLAFSGDREVASDALAEAFAQALSRGIELRSPRAWVWSVAFRLAAAELKSRASTSQVPERGYEFPEPIPHVFAALMRLSTNQRLSVVMHDYADRPTDEIAQVLGSSRATVHVHLSKGRRRLRKLLEADDG